MRRWWTDIEAPDQPWSGLHLRVEAARPGPPPLRVESRLEREFSVVAGEQRILCARPRRYREGVDVELDRPALAHDFPIPPITAEEVRAAPREPGQARARHWCRYFAERLGDHNLLHDGHWALRVGSRWPVPVIGLDRTLELPASTFVRWWVNGGGDCLPMRTRPEPHEGRVKYWRKLAREDRLPPLLLWFISGLDGYVLLDGHRRLLAALLEARPPELITVVSFTEHRWPPLLEMVERIDRERSERARAGALTPEAQRELDRRLVMAYDDRPEWRPRTHAWVRR